jgi:hypothetical protein
MKPFHKIAHVVGFLPSIQMHETTPKHSTKVDKMNYAIMQMTNK